MVVEKLHTTYKITYQTRPNDEFQEVSVEDFRKERLINKMKKLGYIIWSVTEEK